MTKSTLLFLLAAAAMTSTASAHDSYHRSHCDESGCRVGEHAEYNYGPRLTATDRYPDNYSRSNRGQACPNGECGTTSGRGLRDCSDGQCHTGYGPAAANRSRHDFLYSSDRFETAGRSDRRLANPFRPVGYEPDHSRNNRDNRRPIPTRYESQRPVSRGISWQSDIQSAVDDAKRAGLPLLIQVSADWCPHCSRMKRETFADPQLTTIINQRFVAVEVDADQQREFIKQMGIQSLPTTLVVAPDLRILNRLQGFQSASQIMQAVSR